MRTIQLKPTERRALEHLDQARCGHHPKPPPNACAYLISGALECQRLSSLQFSLDAFSAHSAVRTAGARPNWPCRALRGALARLWDRNASRADPSVEVASAWRQRGRATRVYARLMQAGVWVDGHVEWVVAHEELERLARQRAELDGREGLALLRALRAEVHRHLGYASFPQYVEKLFGYSPRTTDDKLRTALALEHLSELRAALCEGTLPWSSVRELA